MRFTKFFSLLLFLAPIATFAQTTFSSLPMFARDMVHDAKRGKIYVAAHNKVLNEGGKVSSLIIIDANTQKIIQNIHIPNHPNILALSHDANYLYIGLLTSSEIQRMDLNTEKIDLTISLKLPFLSLSDIQRAYDIAPLPNKPKSFAVVIGDSNSLFVYDVAIFDDKTPRNRTWRYPNYDPFVPERIEASSDTQIYGYIPSNGFTSASLTTDGISTITKLKPSIFQSRDFLYTNGKFYGWSGQIYDPIKQEVIGVMPQSEIIHVGATDYPILTIQKANWNSGTPSPMLLSTIDQTRYNPIAQVSIPFYKYNDWLTHLLRTDDKTIAFVNQGKGVVFANTALAAKQVTGLHYNPVILNHDKTLSILEFGEITATTEKTVWIKNKGNAVTNISNTTSTNKAFTILPTSFQIKAQDSTQVKIKLNVPQLASLQEGYIYFQGDFTNKKDSLFVFGKISSPANFSVGNFLNISEDPIKTLLNREESKGVSIDNSGKTQLLITKISFSDPAFYTKNISFPILIPANEFKTISVFFKPTKQKTYQANVLFEHNITGFAPLEKTIHGIGVGESILKINNNDPNINPTLNLNFGQLIPEIPKILPLTFSAVGKDSVHVWMNKDYVLSNLKVSLNPASFVIPPNQSRVLNLTLLSNFPLSNQNNLDFSFVHDALAATQLSLYGTTVLPKEESEAPRKNSIISYPNPFYSTVNIVKNYKVV